MACYTTWAEIFAAFKSGELKPDTHCIVFDNDTVFLEPDKGPLEELFEWDVPGGQDIVAVL